VAEGEAEPQPRGEELRLLRRRAQLGVVGVDEVDEDGADEGDELHADVEVHPEGEERPRDREEDVDGDGPHRASRALVRRDRGGRQLAEQAEAECDGKHYDDGGDEEEAGLEDGVCEVRVGAADEIVHDGEPQGDHGDPGGDGLLLQHERHEHQRHRGDEEGVQRDEL